jgi:hypothetical protein
MITSHQIRIKGCQENTRKNGYSYREKKLVFYSQEFGESTLAQYNG